MAQAGTAMPACIRRPAESFSPDPCVDAQRFLPLPPPPDNSRRQHGISQVRLRPRLFALHPAWQDTPLAAAMDASNRVDLHAIAPAMLARLPLSARRQLYTALSTTGTTVVWTDGTGRRQRRQPLWGLPIGRRWHVSGATGLLLRMAACGGHAFTEALYDALLTCIDELHGGQDGNHFTVQDIATVACRAASEVLGGLQEAHGTAPPQALAAVLACQASALIGGACSLIAHYLHSYSAARADALQAGMQHLLGAMFAQLPRDAAHLGLGFGLLLGGGLKYAATIAAADTRRRWRAAIVGNLLWAATGFIPSSLASGAVGVAVVAASVRWDQKHPPRTYADLAHRLNGDLRLALAGPMRCAPLDRLVVSEWMQLVEKLVAG